MRWVAGVVTGIAALAAALSFAPDSVPAAPPPVRLEGTVVDTEPTRNELVVVPFPSVELGDQAREVTSTTIAPALVGEDSPDVPASPDDDIASPVAPPDPIPEDSASSVEASADSVASADSPDDD
jgi:hypothetical protein